MRRTLAAIERTPRLHLTVIATGMHLDRRYGPPLRAVRETLGREPDAVVSWPPARDLLRLAAATGRAITGLARAYSRLGTQGVLLVGDRTEIFAAAAAAHVARIPIAHVHGGDRAEGQTDDAIRHAVTQLSQLHLAASHDAVGRLIRLGQNPLTVHHVGAPGLESIEADARAGHPEMCRRFDLGASRNDTAVVLLHPTSPHEAVERERARDLLEALASAGITRPIVLAPNNDPGNGGIRAAYREAGVKVTADVPRPVFLALLQEVGVLVGNSSSGIIEAPSLRVAVVDVGDRQAGRVRGRAVLHAAWSSGVRQLARTIRRAASRRGRVPSDNPYEAPGAGVGAASTSRRIVRLLLSRHMDYPASPKRLTH